MTDFDLDTNNSDEVGYMVTDECPLCVVNNVETHLNL